MRRRLICFFIVLITIFAGVSVYSDSPHIRIYRTSDGYNAECNGETVYLAAYLDGALVDIAYGVDKAHLSDTKGAVYRAYIWNESSLKPSSRAICYGDDIDFFESFEKYSEGKTTPLGWSVYDWGTNSGMTTGFGRTTDCTDGNYGVYIDALKDGYGGFLTQLPVRFDAPSYDINIDVKPSADYSGNYPKIWFLLYNGSNFVKQVDSTPIKNQVVAGKWTRVHSVLTADAVNDYEFDNMRIVIGTVNDGTSAFGNVAFDNLSVTLGDSVSNYAASDIRADKYAAWYTLGDTVVYKPMSRVSPDIRFVFAKVYNSANKNIYLKTLSVHEFENDGFLYTPTDVGYYEVEFEAETYNGKKVILTDSYTDYADGILNSYELDRRSFAVVKSVAKPMAQRSSKLLFVSSGKSDELKKAELVGFSGVKCSFGWGDTAIAKGFHTERGTFDWKESDAKMERIQNYGYKTVIAGVGSTPPWAAPTDVSGTEVNIAGKWHKNLYAPVDNAYTTEGIYAFAQRYGNKIDAMEFWNEPYYGEAKTAYWYDTTENFVAMNKAAYSAFKLAAPDKTFISAGFFGNTSGSVYLNDLLKFDDYKNSFDMLSFHGRYNIANDYKNVLHSHGLDSIPYENSECYAYGLFSGGEKKDYSVNDMYLVVNYLNHLKEGVKYINFFEINDLNPDEQRLTRGGHTFGLFRNLPSPQPHRGAVVAFNLFDVLNDTSVYKCEYSFGNQKAVRFDDKGKSILFIWNSADSDFSLCSELAGIIGNGTVVRDFEGRIADENDLCARTIYIVTDVDEDALDQLVPTKDGALNNNFVSPYYTCQTVGVTDDSYTPDSGIVTRGNLFDKKTFELNSFLSDRTINIGSTKSSELIGNFSASVGDDGLYIALTADDSTDVSDANSPDELLNYDSIAFAVDCYGNLRDNEVNEYHIGYCNGKPVVYKYHAADIYEALSDDISPSKTILNEAKVKIFRSGNSVCYRVFVPFVELFPYSTLLETDKIRFSLAVYDNDGNSSNCSGTFGGGFVGEKNVRKFGCLSFGGMYTNIGTDKITLAGVKEKNTGKIMLTVYNNDEVCYIMQYDDIPTGKFAIDIPCSENGNYTIKTRDDAGNRHTLYVSVSR